MRITSAALALALLCAASASAEDASEIWVWTTPDGAVHYTDELERVPEAFRESARVAHKEGSGWYQRIQPDAPAAPAAPAPSAPAGAAPSDTAALEAANEATWREEARAVDERIAALAAQVAACGNDHVNLSPGDGSRKRREEREEAKRCRGATDDLAEAQADREALEERAHRADVPPGWVRPQE